jgi:hypothetical protein
MTVILIAKRAKTAFLFLLLLTGCSTYNYYAEPSLPPKIQVFCAPEKKDLIVQYDELPARSDIPRRRAYFLLENEEKIRCGKKPRYIKPAELSVLTLVPIQDRTDPSVSPGVAMNYYVICNGNSFSISGPTNAYPASFDLPTYKSFGISVKEVLAGPAVLTADAIVLGAVAAYCVGAEMARQGQVPTLH